MRVQIWLNRFWGPALLRLRRGFAGQGRLSRPPRIAVAALPDMGVTSREPGALGDRGPRVPERT